MTEKYDWQTPDYYASVRRDVDLAPPLSPQQRMRITEVMQNALTPEQIERRRKIITDALNAFHRDHPNGLPGDDLEPVYVANDDWESVVHKLHDGGFYHYGDDDLRRVAHATDEYDEYEAGWRQLSSQAVIALGFGGVSLNEGVVGTGCVLNHG